MPKIKIRVTFDKVKASVLIKAAANDALTDLGNQALQDVSQYVPKDQGHMENNGLYESDYTATDGKFINRTYGPKKLKFTAALAREEWAKYAKEVHGEEWKKVYQAALKRRMDT